jgi:hypothetical protein
MATDIKKRKIVKKIVLEYICCMAMEDVKEWNHAMSKNILAQTPDLSNPAFEISIEIFINFGVVK